MRNILTGGNSPVIGLWPRVLTLGLYGVALLWVAVSRIELVWSALVPAVLILAALIAVYEVLQRLPRSNDVQADVIDMLSNLLGCLVFMQFAWLPLRMLNHLSMTTALPVHDDALASWDAALGLDWRAYFEFVTSFPAAVRLLDIGYSSLTPVTIIGLLVLVAAGHKMRAQVFVSAFLGMAVFSIVFGPLFPSAGAVAYHGISAEVAGRFEMMPGVYHLPHMLSLRAETGAIVIDPSYLPGLVTFPSFHTAVGVLLCLVFVGLRWVPFVFVYVVIMVASTPVFGGHFIVDLLAGAGLAAVALWITRRAHGVAGAFGAYPKQD